MRLGHHGLRQVATITCDITLAERLDRTRVGDAKVRDGLASHLLGVPRAEVRALTELAAHEAAGYDPVASRAADFGRPPSKLDELLARI